VLDQRPSGQVRRRIRGASR